MKAALSAVPLALLWGVLAPLHAQTPPAAAPAAPAAAAPAGAAAILKGEGLPRDLFEQVLRQQVPLSPDQVREVRREVDAVKRAAAERPMPAPKPVVSSTTLSFAPGQEPWPVRLYANEITTLTFADATGAPWNVARISYIKERFEVTDVDKIKTSSITISPKTEYADASMAVFLEGRDMPLVFKLFSGQKVVDLRLDVTAAARGPNAHPDIVDRGFSEAVNPDLLSTLSGVPPKGARPLLVNGAVMATAWMIANGRILLRMSAPLLSPAYTSIARAQDGTTVYEIPEAPVVLALVNGKPTNLSISGF